jgi:translation elongation factor EF-Tu-like GTPase
MTKHIALKFTATLLLGASALGVFAGSASAQTREHVLLARQVGIVAHTHTGAEYVDTWDKSDG